MQIRENISLKPFNTFGIDVTAQYYTSFESTNELVEVLNYKSLATNKKLVLGGGSNILFTKNFDGLVLKNVIKGIEVVNEDDDHIYIKAGAGENWHQFVLFCVNNNYGGIENLALIPGNIGATPMQNIGAYGVEIKDVFHELEALHVKEKKVYTFSLPDCEFSYRNSVFKHRFKDQFIILSVTYRLTKNHIYNISYGAIQQELEKMNVHELSIKAITQAVINIRTSKLPDPALIGNAGSFFKNPTITIEQFNQLKRKFANIPSYPADADHIKVPAGWLIEKCGPKDSMSWKGFREGDAGCYERQALVLVNYGNASGSEIFQLSERILESVQSQFGIRLEREVNIV
jgi:UDP-N-acetylmuramate dehydrogenase